MTEKIKLDNIALDKLIERFESILDLKEAAITQKKRDSLKKTQFAFPRLEKLPLDTCARVRAAMSYFSSTEGMGPAEKKEAVNKIISAARKCGIDSSGFEKKYKK